MKHCIFQNWNIILRYNCLQQLCRKIIEFLLYRETRGEVKVYISRKSCCTQFYRLLEYQANDGKKNPKFSNEKSAKIFRFSWW